MLYDPSITQEQAIKYFKDAINRVVERDFWLKEHPPVVELPYLLSTKPPVNVDVEHPLCKTAGRSDPSYGKRTTF